MICLNYTIFSHLELSAILVELKMKHELFIALLKPARSTTINFAKVVKNQNPLASVIQRPNVNFFGFLHNGRNALLNVEKAFKVA
jgi:hypothetical protein